MSRVCTLRAIELPDPHDVLPERGANLPVRLLRGLGYVLLFLLVQLVAAVVMTAIGASPGGVSAGATQLEDVVRLCALEGAVLVGALIAIHLRGGFRTLAVDLSGREQRRGWWQLLPVGLLVIAPSVAAAAASGGDPVFASMGAATLIAFIALAALIGIAEELWFHGLVVSAIDASRSPWAAVIGSSILFGLPHLISSDSGVTAATALNAGAVTLAIAVPFACVRVVSRSIVPLIGWHTAIDAWAFLHTSSITAEGTPDIDEAAVALILPSIIAICYLIWFASRHRRRAHSTW